MRARGFFESTQVYLYEDREDYPFWADKWATISKKGRPMHYDLGKWLSAQEGQREQQLVTIKNSGRLRGKGGLSKTCGAYRVEPEEKSHF